MFTVIPTWRQYSSKLQLCSLVLLWLSPLSLIPITGHEYLIQWDLMLGFFSTAWKCDTLDRFNQNLWKWLLLWPWSFLSSQHCSHIRLHSNGNYAVCNAPKGSLVTYRASIQCPCKTQCTEDGTVWVQNVQLTQHREHLFFLLPVLKDDRETSRWWKHLLKQQACMTWWRVGILFICASDKPLVSLTTSLFPCSHKRKTLQTVSCVSWSQKNITIIIYSVIRVIS